MDILAANRLKVQRLLPCSSLNSIVIASCRDENHLTPLLLAARLDHYQTMVLLLDNGAKIGAVSKNKVQHSTISSLSLRNVIPFPEQKMFLIFDIRFIFFRHQL